MTSSEVVGSRRGHHRKASEVMTSRSIREGHMNSYYTIVGNELICVIGSVKAQMWDRTTVSCAVRRRKAERMRSKGLEEKTC